MLQAEAIVTGTLAGYNAVRLGIGLNPVELPVTLAVGDIINHENKMKQTPEGIRNRYTFAGAEYFKRMQDLGLYTTDLVEVEKRVNVLMMKDFFKQRLL